MVCIYLSCFTRTNIEDMDDPLKFLKRRKKWKKKKKKKEKLFIPF